MAEKQDMFLAADRETADFFRRHPLFQSNAESMAKISGYKLKTINMMSALTTHKQFHDDLPINVIEFCIGFSIEMLYHNNAALESFYTMISSLRGLEDQLKTTQSLQQSSRKNRLRIFRNNSKTAGPGFED